MPSTGFSKPSTRNFSRVFPLFDNLQSSFLIHHTNNNLNRYNNHRPFINHTTKLELSSSWKRSEHDDINVFGLLIFVYILHVFITKTCFEEYFERGLHEFNIVGSVLVRPSWCEIVERRWIFIAENLRWFSIWTLEVGDNWVILVFQNDLIIAVESRNEHQFRFMLESSCIDPDKPLSCLEGLSIFEKVLSTPNSDNFIKLCLQNGSDFYRVRFH
jgi:hypothetical protein